MWLIGHFSASPATAIANSDRVALKGSAASAAGAPVCKKCAPCPQCAKQPAAAPAPAAAAAADAAAVTVHDYGLCMATVNSLHDRGFSGEDPNWAAMNKKAETLKLIDEAGGLTDNMRAFMRVYENGVWGRGSGGGSALTFAASTICILSANLLSLLNVTLLIDLPCGDQQWAPTLRLMTPGLKYIGVDAMPGLVQANRERFGHGGPGEPEFFLADMASDNLFERIRKMSTLWTPHDRVAVMSRHVLEHNTYAASFKYIEELHRSGAAYLIGTNALESRFPSNPINSPIAGEYHPLNFHLAPFNFPHGVFSWCA